MTLDEIQNEWEKDAEVDDNYLGESAIATPKLHSKYLKLLIKTHQTPSRFKPTPQKQIQILSR